LPPDNIRINRVILYINPDGNVDRTPKVGWYQWVILVWGSWSLHEIHWSLTIVAIAYTT
jgi:hypothetical protein